MGKPTVSIVIVCMNRPDNLYPCLEGIREHSMHLSPETFVVAYRFSEENLQKAKADFPWASFIESDGIRGFSENNNLALRNVTGEYVYILNDDTEMQMDAIGKLLSDFQKLPDNAAIVTPRLLNADGTLQLCGRPEFKPFNYVLQQWHLYTEPKDDTVGKEPVFGEVYRTCNISGAAFMIRTDVFRELGWFNEAYYFCPEDVELSQKVRKKGLGVYVDKEAVVTHKWKQTASRISPAVRPCSIRGWLMFCSGGSSLKYAFYGSLVWLGEAAKFLKASIRVRKTPAQRLAISTYRNNLRSIFSKLTPKEIFTEYFEG